MFYVSYWDGDDVYTVNVLKFRTSFCSKNRGSYMSAFFIEFIKRVEERDKMRGL